MSNKTDRYFEENKPFAGLGRVSVHGGMILVLARGVSILLQVGSIIVLGRLLSPHDFGLFAMVLALIGFGPMLIDLGTTEAATQKRHLTRRDVSALFWLNTSIGVALALLLAGASKSIASFYDEPALSSIAPIAACTFILTALSTQHCALLRRAMDFRRVALIDLCSNGIGTLVSIAMAFGGWGYWALVAKPVVTSFLTALGAWMSCPWVPGRPEITREVRELVRFGMSVTGFTMTDYFARSADRLALGYLYGATPLGFYQNAFLLYSNLLSLLSEPLHNIAAAGLSKLRNNLDDFRKSWATALSTVSFVSALAFAVLAVVSQDFIVLLLGAKWAPAGSLLSIFAVRGIAQTVERTLGWLHVSAGRSDRWMRWGVFSAICQIAALFCGLPFGFTGVATAYTIVMFALFVPALAYAGRPVGINAKDVFRAVGPQTFAGLCAIAVGLIGQQVFLVYVSGMSRMLLSSIICMSTYVVIAVGLFGVTGPLQLAMSIANDLRGRRYLKPTNPQKPTNDIS